MSSRPVQLVIISFLLGAIVVLGFLPLMEVEYLESGFINCTYDSIKIDYSYEDEMILEPRYYAHKKTEMKEGQTYTFAFGADNIITGYLMTQNQYTSFQNGLTDYSDVIRAKKGEMEYTSDEDTELYFVIQNTDNVNRYLKWFQCFHEIEIPTSRYGYYNTTKKVSILQYLFINS
jgi:hypothetical protein